MSYPLFWLDLACPRFVVQSLDMSTTTTRRPLPDDPTAVWAPIFQSLGLPLYRVHGEDRIALIQAPPEDFARLLVPEMREALIRHGKSLGYLFVTLDMNAQNEKEG